ncbi:MAG: UDPGP type 1 family protein [Planctomycetota bacterium]|nr:UDPGP type 1 family protein [Planctomycetota bacterium]
MSRTTASQEELHRRITEARKMLEEIGQSHLLHFVEQLETEECEALLDQIESMDMPTAARIVASARTSDFRPPSADRIRPAGFVPHRPPNEEAARAHGRRLIHDGKVAAFTVAGGQGTRLGWNGPKGSFPASPLTGKPLFRMFAEQIKAMSDRAEKTIPWYIMTSPINDADTRAFFRDNNYFGLDRTSIFMFPQGVLPSFDEEGRFMLAGRSQVAVNPDGHGGSLRALRNSGAIEDMKARGIEQISYFQVDNPAVKALDPVFIGLHAIDESSSGEMSSKMVPKSSASEKVGVFCEVDGRNCVIEYSDLPEELAEATNPDGSLTYTAGSIAIHLLSVEFVDRLTGEEASMSLPLHQAHKKVPYTCLETGALVNPESPNATKLELFIFDAIPLAERSMVYETDRVEEFAPIKNAEGGDSPATSAALQFERSARWLERAGLTVPRESDGTPAARIEISSLSALGPEDLPTEDTPSTIDAGDEFVI